MEHGIAADQNRQPILAALRDLRRRLGKRGDEEAERIVRSLGARTNRVAPGLDAPFDGQWVVVGSGGQPAATGRSRFAAAYDALAGAPPKARNRPGTERL
jgi:hypothetical protein